ncbi:MAG: hypothetical protein JSU94_18085, partial [Phycisphaerales bacterium]
MSRYSTTVLAIATIILAVADGESAALPSAEIVSPNSPVDANMLERLEFTIRGTDPGNDLRLCEMYVDGVHKGSAHFAEPQSGAEATWTYAFGTPGTRTVEAVPLDKAGHYGTTGVTWTVRVRNIRDSLELTVLTYNTHLFEDSTVECLCRCGAWIGKCSWEDPLGSQKGDYIYEDGLRIPTIASRVENFGADIVALQEVWSPAKQADLATLLQDTYPYAAYFFPDCDCRNAFPDIIESCIY